ncbi:hypothetical protein IFM89_019360 [Coptis chinensis]|uniref:Uncharacterized protein n=1 Tax=Coptis chinensis TaxID=261450 RepID=A0A835IX67_9MAGN|nr:hypothetical protein IFM89_019360 [Coptis chinensis]
MINLSSFNSIRIEIRLSDFKSLLAYDSSLLPFWIHSQEKLKVLELAINNPISRLSEPRQAIEDILRLMANFLHRNMAEKGYKSIKEINDTNGSYRIKVRVSRIWEATDFNTDKIKSLDMLLIDEHGDQIHTKIPISFVFKYKPQLKEVQIYYMEEFSTFKIYEKVYRPVNHDYIIMFNWNTILKPSKEEDIQFPKQLFNFTNFSEVSSRKDNIHLTVKTWTQPIEKLKKNKNKTTMMKIYLIDEWNSFIAVTIWGENANNVKDWIVQNTSRRIVLIISSTSVSYFNGTYSLSTTSATKVYQNPKIPEFTVMKNSPMEVEIQEEQMKTSKSTEEVMTQNRRCLSEITNSVTDLFSDEKYFACKASIIKVMHENGWYYNACPNPNCGKKLNTNAEGYDCTKHGVVDPIQKYILKFDIEDKTATVRATAFEEVALTLMKKSAAELITIDSTENGTKFAKKEFRKLIGHTAIFQIRVTKFNKERNINSLTISKVFPLHNDYYNGE